MKPTSPALILYIVASFFAVLAVMLDNDLLMLIAKPIIAPAAFYYYLQVKTTKINWLFAIAFLCSFTSDMIVIFNLEYGDVFISLFNTTMYLLLLYISIKDVLFKSLNFEKLFYSVIVIMVSLFIVGMLLDLMNGIDELLGNLYLVYGIVLALLVSVVSLNYFNKYSKRLFYAVIMCICFLISDISYAIYNFYMDLEIFNIFNVAAQFASYYYMIKYITTKNDTLNSYELTEN